MNKSGITAIVCLLVLAASRSLATDERKLSGYVKSLITQSQPSASRSLTDGRMARPTLTAFLKVDAAHADEVRRNYGLRYHARKGDIAIASIPIDRLAALSDHHAVRRIEANPSATLTMDTTRTIVGADKLDSILLHSPLVPHQLPFTGQGVVVGVMDVGFDLTHPNFLDVTTNRYRIAAFWDQLSQDTVGSTLPVGRDFVGYEKVHEQQHSRDGFIQTHGTHTLGIAAGSGYDSPYRGIAYDADLCIVANAISSDIELIDSADYYKYTSATDALGFKYIFDYADSVGKPCVISFSEGYVPYLDSEDSLYAAFLDSLSSPGHIIVSSAGNEGFQNTYMEKKSETEAVGSFIDSNSNQGSYRIKADGPFSLTFYTYPKEASTDSSRTDKPQLTILSSQATQDSLLADTLFCCGDTCIITLKRHPSAFTAIDTVFLLSYEANKRLSDLSFHTALIMKGQTTHAELFASSKNKLANLSVDTRWNDAQKGHNILAPACFAPVITVGATAHRLGFTNYKGNYHDNSSQRTAGLLSPYSSTGPTMHGLTKPDVVAPGDNVISSYSSYYLESKPDASDIDSDVSHFDFQGRTYAWNANTGTSMSCPVVAGVIALWLQAKPDLTREEVLGVLSRTCRQPDATLAYPNNQYGYGEIDAYRGLLYILGIDQIEDVSLHQPSLLHLTIHGDKLVVETAERRTTPLIINIYNLNGSLVFKTTLQPSASGVQLPSIPQGIYAVQINSADHRFTGSQLIRK